MFFTVHKTYHRTSHQELSISLLEVLTWTKLNVGCFWPQLTADRAASSDPRNLQFRYTLGCKGAQFKSFPCGTMSKVWSKTEGSSASYWVNLWGEAWYLAWGDVERDLLWGSWRLWAGWILSLGDWSLLWSLTRKPLSPSICSARWAFCRTLFAGFLLVENPFLSDANSNVTLKSKNLSNRHVMHKPLRSIGNIYIWCTYDK